MTSANSKSTGAATPMAADRNAAARVERDKAVKELDVQLVKILDQWAGMSAKEKKHALDQVNEITQKKEKLLSDFVEKIFNSKDLQGLLKQLSDFTKKMNDESKKIKDTTSLLECGAKIITYAADVLALVVALG